jgi:hypothetical protein
MSAVTSEIGAFRTWRDVPHGSHTGSEADGGPKQPQRDSRNLRILKVGPKEMPFGTGYTASARRCAMPCAVRETTAVTATASSKRYHSDAAPVIIAKEPESARSAAEQRASDSEPRCHETQTELAAHQVAFRGQLPAIDCRNQPAGQRCRHERRSHSRLLLTQPRDTEAIRRLLACVVEGGMRTGDIANRTRALIKDAITQGMEAVTSLTDVDAN